MKENEIHILVEKIVLEKLSEFQSSQDEFNLSLRCEFEEVKHLVVGLKDHLANLQKQLKENHSMLQNILQTQQTILKDMDGQPPLLYSTLN